MAWIKVKDIKGKMYTVPESVFANSYESSGAFIRVEEPKPEKKSKKVEVEKNDKEIQQFETVEIETPRKDSKKA
jgi:hypothetical protein